MANDGEQNSPDDDDIDFTMEIQDVRRSPETAEGYEPMVLSTSRGAVEMRYYPARPAAATRAALFVGGVGGGFDSPSRGTLYPKLCRRLQDAGVVGLRVQFRHSTELEEAVLDVLAGISFLDADGISSVALVGHSFGGAVVLQAAAAAESVQACVTLATQSYGAKSASELGPRCPLLVVHGLADQTLPASCSQYVYRIAREPKDLLLKEGVGHGLDEWAQELPDVVFGWITRHLPG